MSISICSKFFSGKPKDLWRNYLLLFHLDLRGAKDWAAETEVKLRFGVLVKGKSWLGREKK